MLKICAIVLSLLLVSATAEPPVTKPLVLKTYKDAMESMAKYDVPGIFVFQASWCDPCHKMDKDCWEPLMAEIKSKYIIYFVDIDGERKVFDAWYKMGMIKNVPAYAITNRGATKLVTYGEGYRDRDEFVNWANAEIQKWREKQSTSKSKDTAPTLFPPHNI